MDKAWIEKKFKLGILSLAQDDGKGEFKAAVKSLKSFIDGCINSNGVNVETAMHAHKALELLTDAKSFFGRDW